MPEFRWRGGASGSPGTLRCWSSCSKPVCKADVRWMLPQVPTSSMPSKSFQHCRILPSPSSIAVMSPPGIKRKRYQEVWFKQRTLGCWSSSLNPYVKQIDKITGMVSGDKNIKEPCHTKRIEDFETHFPSAFHSIRWVTAPPPIFLLLQCQGVMAWAM